MAKTIRCPECGHIVESYFDHIDIDCEHDMTPQEIAELLRKPVDLNDDAARDNRLHKGLRAWNAGACDAST